MDYTLTTPLQKTRLANYQWDECHDWDLGVIWGEDEKEGKLNTKLTPVAIISDKIMLLKYKTLLILSFFPLITFSQIKQNKLDLMQGIWGNIVNTDCEKAFTIIKGMNSINFVYSTSSNELDFPLSESLEGFQNSKLGEKDSLNINSLTYDGLYYTIVDKKYISEKGWVHRPDYLTPNYFECNGELMSINGGQLIEYEKIQKLPIDAISKLYLRSKNDKRNYIKEHLEIEVAEISTAKSIIYSEPGKPSTTKLNKGDVVTVLEEKVDWIKVDYGADTVGWVKKEDLDKERKE